MSYLESLSREISTLESVLYKAVKDLDRLKSSHDALVNKPEYPDGTLGLVSGNDHKGNLFVRLINVKNKDFPYSGTTYFTGAEVLNYRYFNPLTEAILPMPVENTGVCPWKDGDEVRVEFDNGDFITDNTPEKWYWTSTRGNNIVRSQLIRSAGK